MIKIDLITGFLGSGKTTFLLKYADFFIKKGFKVGILEYDYGALNTDMLLLNRLRGEKCEIEMVAAACDEDCLKRRFRTKLISMAMSGYDRVIIEPSGVFDMDMFYDTVRDDDVLEKWYEIGSVLTIVNAGLPEEIGSEADFILASQAVDAGCIIFSRTQNYTCTQLESTKQHIRCAAKKIHCNKFEEHFFEKNWECLTDGDFVYFAGCGYHVRDYEKITAGRSSEYSSVSFLDLPDTLDQLIIKIKELFEDSSYGRVERVKGFASNNGISCQINATPYEILTEPVGMGNGDIIIIGTGLNKKKIEELIHR